MAVYVTSAGLQIPTVEDLLADLSQEQRAEIDPLLNTNPDGPIGQLNGIFASHLREAWETLLIAWQGCDPDAAEGFLLEALSALTGTLRAPATKGQLAGSRKATVNLNATTTLPAGSVAHVVGQPTNRWVTTEDVTNSGGSPANVLVTMEAETAGSGFLANAGTLTVIATPVVGWNSVTNTQDAIPGTDEDTDAQLRERREEELRATGAGTVDAIRADLLALTYEGTKPVLECTVFENVQDFTDPVLGLPPHSLECLVYDGVAAATPNSVIAQVIWDSKPAGIQAYGSISGTAMDAVGDSHIVPFTRPTIRSIKMDTILTIDAATYVGDTAAKQALADRVLAVQKPGGKVRWSEYVETLMDLAGVVAVSYINIQYTGSPYGAANTDLVIGPREQVTLAVGDITLLTSGT
jgi:uncharacterized phage protein gp47/JayE